MYTGGQEQARCGSKMGPKALEELLGATQTSWPIRGHVPACLARLFWLRPRLIYVLNPAVLHTLLSRESWRSIYANRLYFLSLSSSFLLLKKGGILGCHLPFLVAKVI